MNLSENYDTDQVYASGQVAIDVVILALRQGHLCCRLQQRQTEPFHGQFELLGGLLRGQETAEQTLIRKIVEYGISLPKSLIQFGVFTEPLRDPRQRTISIGYLALTQMESTDSAELWFDIDQLPALAFDHQQIIKAALNYLKIHGSAQIIAPLLPDMFTLTQLQQAYQAVLQTELDTRNFRKQVLHQQLITPTTAYQQDVGHRPAKLYTFSSR